MKPAIAYGVIGSEFGSSWEILSITSEKSGRRGMVYGRDEHGNATHHKPGLVHGRFKTIGEAETARNAIRAIHRAHAPAIEAAEVEAARLRSLRNAAIRSALANVKISKPVEVR